MPLRFDQEPTESNRPAHKPPPNYQSRRVHLRVFALVMALMFVIVAMYESRNPKYYRWLGFNDSLSESEISSEEIDTRLRTMQGSKQQEVNTITIPGAEKRSNSERESGDDAEVDAIHREKVDTWSKFLKSFENQDRLQLYKVLKAARDGKALPTDELERWNRIFKQLDRSWEQNHNESLQAVYKMSDENPEKQTWLLVVHKLQKNWALLKDSLQLAVEGRPLLEDDQQVLGELQSIIDEIALQAIEDNTVASRSQEYDAWFRFFDILNTSTKRQLERQSEGRVGFVQLFKQPTVYRGKLVTVRGTAQMAYHVRAPRNIYGIDGYYVFVINPAGGPNSPIMVYSLQTPTGFPEIKDKDVDRETTTLKEDVEFTGFFFKNWAYRAKDGTRTAPLVMAKVPEWDASANATEFRALPNVTVIVIGLIVTAALGALISVVVYMQSRDTSPTVANYDATNMKNPERLKLLEKVELAPSIVETLDQLAATHDGTDSAHANEVQETDD